MSDATSTCLICGTPVFGLHCKVVCPNCGYREDCSDLFRVEPEPIDSDGCDRGDVTGESDG